MRSNEKLFIFLSLLSLAGLPPFLGFFRKIIILFFLIRNSLYMLSLFLVVSSVSLIFLYSRVFLNSLIIQVLFNKVSHCSNNYIGRLKIIFVLFFLALIVFFTVQKFLRLKLSISFKQSTVIFSTIAGTHPNTA